MMVRTRLTLVLILLWGGGHASAQAEQSQVERGERIFAKQCAGCHSVQAGVQRAGPSLYGVIGRSVGKLPGYEFSTVLREADFVWTPEVLDVFLRDPSAMLPDSYMVFWGLGDPQREQVIHYLEYVASGQ